MTQHFNLIDKIYAEPLTRWHFVCIIDVTRPLVCRPWRPCSTRTANERVNAGKWCNLITVLVFLCCSLAGQVESRADTQKLQVTYSDAVHTVYCSENQGVSVQVKCWVTHESTRSLLSRKTCCIHLSTDWRLLMTLWPDSLYSAQWEMFSHVFPF